MTWIDVLTLITLAVAFASGWRAGFVAEFFDAGSLVIAAALATLWSSAIATGLPPDWPLSEPARHVFALWTLFLVIYLAMRVLGWFATRNRDRLRSTWIASAGGGLIGAAKAFAALFAILYIALFGQIDPQLRDTLRRSPIARACDAHYAPINDAIVGMTPPLYRLIARRYMHDHRL